ncbi:isopentenyl-diphosphate delta-isomerase [Micromonospora sp. ATCC 39149]|nr:isopentenyl-diphosphate delta-isomerase [Micromonospora sp. ATCC 39149]
MTPPMTDREQHLVELVDQAGTAVGSCTVARAHRVPGLAHRAFSILLVDPAGRLLLQRRAATKTRFAGLWANACCGHPAPGDDLMFAATRRLREELGVSGTPLTEIGVHRYRADDPGTGRVEHEHDHVLVGSLAADQHLQPDPSEIAEIRWMPPKELAADVASFPDRYTPWLPGLLAIWQATRPVG